MIAFYCKENKRKMKWEHTPAELSANLVWLELQLLYFFSWLAFWLLSVKAGLTLIRVLRPCFPPPNLLSFMWALIVPQSVLCNWSPAASTWDMWPLGAEERWRLGVLAHHPNPTCCCLGIAENIHYFWVRTRLVCEIDLISLCGYLARTFALGRWRQPLVLPATCWTRKPVAGSPRWRATTGPTRSSPWVWSMGASRGTTTHSC